MIWRTRCHWLCIVAVALPVACATIPGVDDPEGRFSAVVIETTNGIEMDGRFDEPVWSECPSYGLHLARQAHSTGNMLQESGRVRFVHDDQWLYIGVSFEDSDVVAEGTQDQEHHYQLGDVAEVFIKPVDKTWYWELYVTPTGLKSAFFIPGRGRLPLPSNFETAFSMRVGSRIDGTLNNWHDIDVEWTAEIAIPLKELTAEGEIPDIECLTVLVARYNYSRYLKGRELSSWPALDRADFHRYEEYARLTSR